MPRALLLEVVGEGGTRKQASKRKLPGAPRTGYASSFSVAHIHVARNVGSHGSLVSIALSLIPTLRVAFSNENEAEW